MVKIAEQDTSLLNLFNESRSLIEKDSSPLVNQWRTKAEEAFKQLGIPSNKVEAYKYTNLQPWFKAQYAYSFSENGYQGKIDEIFKCDVESMESHTVFMVNGKFIPGSNGNVLPQGVVIGSFSELAKKHSLIIEKYYSKIAPVTEDGMVALNTMFANDGIFIHVPAGKVVEKPIQIVNILTGEKDLMVNQRNLIVIEENAQARVLFCDHTLTQSRFVINSVTEAQIDATANLDFYNIQNQHNGTIQVGGYYFNQEKQSVLNANYFTLHTGIARNNIFARLGGEHAENHISGLYLIDKNQHVDNFSYINHAVPDCESNELFKGVMDDASTGAFTGRILVAKDAQRTNAYQSNNNLLLTENAKMNTRPQLEIYADDVKCSHGATVGQLDDNALFYLRARGISKEEANILLRFAFAYEVIEKIQMPELKEQIRELVEKRFRGELDKCDSCVVCGQVDKNAMRCV
ncbi:Fe-S cluster assembly protein SufD [Natronoflexus pectinivorans]|uniref:Fe-S cluster assembly protein SufD n=1 Tax=Natronoflexus pectinivorans TaxID=682526 RepID=A0A4R2GHQ7_9BACT|nr:Fe-S cluster assembly protein SufD [Natronoflexus pectinivorans]TCO07965.1 Fe-S cluster assembly protein SufD [Natronoflexus pectinivorans]